MSCETFNQDLEMINAGCCSSDSPLNTQFLLPAFEEDKLCPRFYGKNEEKQKVYHALKNDMRAEVQTKWGDLRCHCSGIPILRLSKTARNLNKVFLTCRTPASAETRCKYFQWIHTPLFIDKRLIHKFNYATNLRRAEWKQQGNVEAWKQRNGCYSKQDAQTQTEQKQQQTWLNQFAESAKKQEEQRKAQTRYPWKSTPLPSTFHWSPEKREQWNEVHSIANHQFFSRVQGWYHLPESDASVARYLEKQKSKGYFLSPADEKFLEACRASKHAEWKPPPGAEKYEKNEAAIAKAVTAERPFGYLPEKVCSLATYCRDRKKEGLPLTPVQERFFAQLVNMYHKEPEVPQYQKQFLDNVKQLGSQIRSVRF